MKIFKILLVTAIAFGMMACNNEDVPKVIDGPEATISVKVFPSSNSPGLRSVGDLSDEDATTSLGLAAESEIKTLEVWIFENGNLKGYQKGTGNAVEKIETFAGLMKIVVVANANIDSKPTLAELLAEVKALPAKDVIEEAGTGLVMTAEPFELTLKPGNNYYGYVLADVTAPVTPTFHSATALPITRVNARVALVSTILDYNNVPANQKNVFDALKDVQVAMFNVPKTTGLFGTSLATNTAFQYGVQWPSPDLSYVGVNDSPAAPNALLDEGPLTLPATLHNLIEKTKAPYFYVNENTSDVEGDKETTPSEKMLIVLRAKPYLGDDPVTSLKDLYTDAEGYTYYPVWVNKDGVTLNGNVGNSNVYRNTQYNISLTIKGLGRPTIDEVDEAWLDVKVEVEDWAVVNQNVVW